MHDDLATLLRTSANEISVPDQRVTEVLREGRRRKVVRRMVASGAALVLILAGWVSWSSLTPFDDDVDIRPVNDPVVPGIDRRLIVVPAPEGAGPAGTPEAVADARAVAFSFHTLLRTVGYERYDYKSFERVDGGWLVWFEDGPTVDDLEELLRSRRFNLQEFADSREDELERLERLRSELQEARNDESESVRITARIEDSKESIRSRREALQETRAELKAISQELRDVREHGTPRIELIVAREGEWMVVRDVSGPFAEKDELSIRTHRERVDSVDVHGTDWYNVRLVGPGVADDIPGVEAYGFTTTPIPSSYREECLVILRDGAGAVVYRQRDIHDMAEGAPQNEDSRDEWVMSTGIDDDQISKPHDRLIPDFECHEGNGP